MTIQPAKLTSFDRATVAIAALSVCALLLELTWPHALEKHAPAPEVPTLVEHTALDVVPVGTLSDYLPVSERPLFTSDRKPFVAVAEPAPVVPPTLPPKFELTAVVMTKATQMALLRSNLTPTVQRVALSETIEGWTLAEVTPGSVVLRRDAETVTVALRPDLDGARSGHAARVSLASGGN